MMTNPITFRQVWVALRRRGALAVCVALLMMGLSLSGTAKAAHYITIDAPAANPGTTTLINNNALGTIVGAYQDGNSSWHGFLRTLDGHYTIIDAPGADPGAYHGTGGPGINLNDLGAVTGTYVSGDRARHGFSRTPDGHYTTIDVAPGVGYTFGNAINLAGEIGGTYSDTNGVHDFLRARNGTITTVNAPGANGATWTWGTWGYGGGYACLNQAGAFIGLYFDSNGAPVSFVRAPNGKLTLIQDPAANGAGTIPMAINSAGAITGAYSDDNGVLHGYLRTANGNLKNFDFPGSANAWPTDINLFGAIVGGYSDVNGGGHGFLRTPDGRYTTIDFPGATGTGALAINLFGQIIGQYYDADGNQHGFLLIP